MARPNKATVDYYPHSTTHGKTMFIIESQFGNDGYAFWFKLLEILGNSVGHFCDCNNPDNWEYLQAYTRLNEDSCIQILNKLAKLDAIDRDLWEQEKIIWSDNFVAGIKDAYKRRTDKLPLKPSLCMQKPFLNNINVDGNPKEPQNNDDTADINGESKEKEKVNNESKENNNALTKQERDALAYLKTIANYPFVYETDLRQVREWLTDFPQKDILAELKAWAAWLRDNPKKLNGRVNYRTRFTNWLKPKTWEVKKHDEIVIADGSDTRGDFEKDYFGQYG